MNLELIIDIGNSNCHCGIIFNKEIIQTYRFKNSNLNKYNILSNTYKHIYISTTNLNIIPNITNLFNTQYTILNNHINTKILSNTPNEIGADRYANLIYLSKINQKSGIVIDCGTATTIDVIHNNKIIGGTILPGLKSSFNAIRSNCQLLNSIKWKDIIYNQYYHLWDDKFNNIINLNTYQNIYSGIILANVLTIKQYIKIIKNKYFKQQDINVFITGGLSRYIIQYLPKCLYDPLFTLKGIILWYTTNLLK